MSDNVNHPDHYGGEENPYEVIKVMKAWLTPEEYIGAMKFNVHKYNARARKKGGVEDYKKAQFYQNELVNFSSQGDIKAIMGRTKEDEIKRQPYGKMETDKKPEAYVVDNPEGEVPEEIKRPPFRRVVDETDPKVE